MNFEQFKLEVTDELEDRGMSTDTASQAVKNCEHTIKGCYDREMTAEETADKILQGR